MTKRSAVTCRKLPSSPGASRGYQCWSAENASVVAAPATAIPASAAANQSKGRRTRSARRPAHTLPIARPAMKLAHTVLAA